MTKTTLSRKELAEKALTIIRQTPGCEGVKEVSVTPVEVVDSGTLEWLLSVIDPGECEQEIAFNAAMRVQDELARQFELERR
jgi:hypothetical protein